MPEWRKITGYAEVIAYQSRLKALADSCGQSGCVDDLEYQFCAPYQNALPADSASWSPGATDAFSSKSRRPTLLIEAGADGLTAAVLLYEHLVCSFATGVFTPIDPDGLQTVVAPADRRLDVVRQSTDFLLSKGGRIVMFSLNEGEVSHTLSHALLTPNPKGRFSAGLERNIGWVVREVSRFLPLADTYDATLLRMGPRTRRNFRSLSRKAVKNFGAVYVSNPQIDLKQYLDLSRACTYPVPDWVAAWRYRSIATQKGVMTSGLRAADGQWLSLIGGRRRADTISVDWQLNRSDSGSASLGTVMRSFLIADEIARGTRGIRFEGGTSHSVQGAFTREFVSDFVFARRAFSPSVMRFFARLFRTGGRLRETVLSDEITWLSEKRTASDAIPL